MWRRAAAWALQHIALTKGRTPRIDRCMSFDYEVVVRARKKKGEKIRELATKLALSYAASLVTNDEDEESDDDYLELHVAFPRGGGTIEITRLLKGYRLHIDSQRDGNRDSWEDIGSLLNDLASKLGTVVDDETAAGMIEESEDDTEVPELASIAIITLQDPDGAVLDESRVSVSQLQQYIDPGGMLRNCALHSMLSEDGRYAARAAQLVALLHDSDGEQMRRHRWKLDGYGRIVGIDIDELWR
jgi:hypothetical protein